MRDGRLRTNIGNVATLDDAVAALNHELLRAEVERLLAVGGAPGADHVSAGLTCELRHHRPLCARRAVREDALPRPKVVMVEHPGGTAIGDIRYTLQTDGGDVLYIQSRGVRHGSAR